MWYARLGGIAWRGVVIAIAAFLVVSGLVALSAVILPTVIGLMFACGLDPISRALIRRGVARSLAAAAAVLLLMGAVAVVAWLTMRAVVDQWDGIVALLEAGRANLVDAAADSGIDPDTASHVAESLADLVSAVAEVLVNGIVQLVPAVAGFVASVLLALVVAFFFLKDGPSMWVWITERVGGSGDLADRIGRRAWGTLRGFIVGQAAIATADAALITLAALIIGVPEAGAIFMLTFFGAFVPFIGAFLSGRVAVLLAIGDGGLDKGVAMLVAIIAVQALEGTVLQPWIQGRAVRLHPLVIALAVTAGGALAGFLGVFLAVPVTAAGVVALSELRSAGYLGPGTGAGP